MKNVLTLIAITIISCAKDNQVPSIENAQQNCIRPEILTAPDQSWLKEDEDRIPVFVAGCKRHYTRYHCPSKVLKTKNLSYQVTCKREK
jgi:hypothetical protein